jgi:hypothetical protein
MGKTDWKAKAKALKKELKGLREPSATSPKVQAKKAKLVSPLAPARVPDRPLSRGV